MYGERQLALPVEAAAGTYTEFVIDEPSPKILKPSPVIDEPSPIAVAPFSTGGTCSKGSCHTYYYFHNTVTFTSIGFKYSGSTDGYTITVFDYDDEQSFDLDFIEDFEEHRFDFDPPMTSSYLEVRFKKDPEGSYRGNLGELNFYGVVDY